MPSNKRTSLSVRLSTEMEERLTRLAEKTNRSKSFYAKEALLLTLAIMERFPTKEDRWRRRRDLAKAILKEVKLGADDIDSLTDQHLQAVVLQRIRENSKLVPGEAARRIGIHKAYYTKVENGIEPPPENVNRWIGILGETTLREAVPCILRELREAFGLTEEEAAKRVDVSEAAYVGAENGEGAPHEEKNVIFWLLRICGKSGRKRV